MNKKILVISESETFSVRGLEMKLQGLGLSTQFSTPKLKEVEERCQDTAIIVLYTDDSIGEAAEVLVYIKDYCIANDEKVIIIGSRDEQKVVEQYIPEKFVLNFYERPLDMGRLLDDIENYMAEESEYERKKSILIVDDDVSYMSIIHDWLKDKYRVSMCASGMQAITWLARNHADLILLDYEMPVTSGPQVLEMIHSEAETSMIPVMFLTGKNDRESIMKVLDLKPTDYLLKTIDRAGLREKIDNFFMSRISE